MIETFQTARLNAERLRGDHLDELRRMHRDTRVMATLGGIRTEAETQRFLETNLAHWQHHHHGLWIFRDLVDGRFVGRGGLRRVEIEGAREVELAYALMSEEWGRELATEMAWAIVRIGFDRLVLSSVVCFTLTTNRASQRVMEKAGLLYDRVITHAGQPHLLYRLDRAGPRQ
jgi:RimJ/RimL family protein N-acetyltransferase